MFFLASIVMLHVEGPSFLVSCLMGLFYILTVGRRGLFSGYGVLSLAMIHCLIPSPLLCIATVPNLISSQASYMIEPVLWIALSRWPLFLKPAQHTASRWHIFKSISILVFIQGLYGSAFQFYYPNLLAPLEWRMIGPSLEPQYRYPSDSTIQFFYEDRQEADKIEAHLPEVIEVLKGSFFYRKAEDLVLVQKSKIAQDGLTEAQMSYTRGTFYLPKQYSYYFTSSNAAFASDEIYYSHNNPYRSVVLHELSHQMLSRYYGKWFSSIAIETWKRMRAMQNTWPRQDVIPQKMSS